MKTKHIQPILVGIASMILSHLINGVVFLFLTYYPTARYDDGFFFPIAFVIAAVYGWWSKNYLYSFLVGIFFHTADNLIFSTLFHTFYVRH